MHTRLVSMALRFNWITSQLPTLGRLAEVGDSAVGLPDAGPPPVIPVAYAVVDREVKNARFHERGDPEKLGEEVPRRWLAVFGGAEVPHDSGSGRRELAEWVAGHPLLARVMVNRIWEWHFGRGLVRSSNDFGTRGESPTHPELLDLLAARFVQSGYSVKAMHRLILHTAAYQRASATPAAGDPENRWLAHFSRRRLTAEELRDSLLAVSGRLDLSPGEAHPFPAEATWTFTQHAPFDAAYETDRRSAFLMVQRQRGHRVPRPVQQRRTRTLRPPRGKRPRCRRRPCTSSMIPSSTSRRVSSPTSSWRRRMTTLGCSWRPASCSTVCRRRRSRQRTQRFLGSYPGEPAEKWSALARVLLASNEFLYVE